MFPAFCKKAIYGLVLASFLLTSSTSFSEDRPEVRALPAGDLADHGGQERHLPLFESLQGLNINYSADQATGIITIFIDERGGKLTMLPGSRHVVIDKDRVITLEYPPLVNNGSLMAEKSTIPSLIALISSLKGSGAPAANGVEDISRIDRFLKTIVVDPGHGGKDSGALGPLGIREKDIVLRIAIEAKELIERKLGVRVVLTRSGDYFVPLEERAVIAASNDADLFISIHSNSTKQKSIKGVETYFMSIDASDEDAMATAELENSVIELEEELNGAGSDLAAILFDMAQTEHLNDSSEFAKILHKNMISALEAEDRGVKQAPFRVLADAAMPAILLEVGFMSNPYESMVLTRYDTHKKTAEAIFKSIENYRKILETRMSGKDDLTADRL